MKTGRYNLKELLTHNEIEQIIIPEIQRDYVWQEENVDKLSHSILDRFRKKTKKKISIQIDGLPILNDSISGFMQHEYDRLIHNLKIGFIYAYHDNEYAGKFFLIDGQQRFTTLYLLLLCLYKKAGKQPDFRNIYFKHDQLKIDYKVREASHDFMVEFVKNELAEIPENIKKIRTYYTEYNDDITIRNIIKNYNRIETLFQQEKDLNALIYFVEEFVEVNYFDTNLSQQGEQLYLYMNSRGESLSYQELIKSGIIEKIKGDDKEVVAEKKKNAGKLWEDWQNFFWNYRINNKNENADIGFQEFLKWVSIIQICTSNNVELEILTINDRGTDRPQRPNEAKENYIHRYTDNVIDKKKIKFQNSILEKYQIESPTFNVNYLEDIFKALEYLYSLDSVYTTLDKKWLANNMKTLDYIIVCPLLWFISNSQWEDPDVKMRDIKRMAMFLKNIAWFESTLGRNPDNATIEALELVKELCNAKKTDITYFLDESFTDKFKSILTKSERFKLLWMKALDSFPDSEVSRNEFEEFIWEISLNENISGFTEGDITIIFDCVDFEYPGFNQNLVLTRSNLYELNTYRNVLENVIIKFGFEDILRRALLSISDKDYLLEDNGGSWHFGPYMQRYSFIQKGNFNTEWRRILRDKKDNIILRFMQLMKIHLNENIFEFLNSLCQDYSLNDWREPFIKEPALLKYCGNKKILWENDCRIILLSSIKAGSACEIQTKLLSYKFEKAWIYHHNIFVLDFNIVDGQWHHAKDNYAIDIKYENSKWHFSILHRIDGIDKQKLEIFKSAEGWDVNQKKDDRLRARKTDNLLYTDDPSKSIIENVEEVYKQVMNLQEEVTKLFAENEIEVTVDNTLQS